MPIYHLNPTASKRPNSQRLRKSCINNAQNSDLLYQQMTNAEAIQVN